MPTPIATEIRPLTNTCRNLRRITPSVACFLLPEAHGGRTRFVAFNPTRKCPQPHKWKCTLNSLLLIGWKMLRSARDWWQGLFVKRVQLEYGEREENVGKRLGEIKWKCCKWQIDFYSKSEENYKRCTFTNSSPCSKPQPSVSSRHKHTACTKKLTMKSWKHRQTRPYSVALWMHTSLPGIWYLTVLGSNLKMNKIYDSSLSHNSCLWTVDDLSQEDNFICSYFSEHTVQLKSLPSVCLDASENFQLEFYWNTHCPKSWYRKAGSQFMSGLHCIQHQSVGQSKCQNNKHRNSPLRRHTSTLYKYENSVVTQITKI